MIVFPSNHSDPFGLLVMGQRDTPNYAGSAARRINSQSYQLRTLHPTQLFHAACVRAVAPVPLQWLSWQHWACWSHWRS
jgi:hypothetical protein